ncbi:MAG: DinB family protein [Blastocatellia bacterium]
MYPGAVRNRSVELISELKKYYSEVEEIKLDAEDLTRGLIEDQFNWRPNPEKWSINECLEHLNMTARLYWSVLAQAVNGARINGWFSKGPYKRAWIGGLMIRSTEPPARMKFKASRRFRPPSDIPMNQVVSQFMAFQDRLLDLIRDANGVDLGRPRIHSPRGGFFKLTLGQGIGLAIAHERRHLWQAQRVKYSPSFPKGPEW